MDTPRPSQFNRECLDYPILYSGLAGGFSCSFFGLSEHIPPYLGSDDAAVQGVVLLLVQQAELQRSQSGCGNRNRTRSAPTMADGRTLRRCSLTGIIRVIIIILRFCSGRRRSGGRRVVDRRFGSRKTGSGDNRLPFVLYQRRRRRPPPRASVVWDQKPARHIDLHVPLWVLEGAAGVYLRRGPSAGGVWRLTPASRPSSRLLAKAGPRHGRQPLFLLSVPVVLSQETTAAPDEDDAAADEDDAAPDEDDAAATLRRQHISCSLYAGFISRST